MGSWAFSEETLLEAWRRGEICVQEGSSCEPWAWDWGKGIKTSPREVGMEVAPGALSSFGHL